MTGRLVSIGPWFILQAFNSVRSNFSLQTITKVLFRGLSAYGAKNKLSLSESPLKTKNNDAYFCSYLFSLKRYSSFYIMQIRIRHINIVDTVRRKITNRKISRNIGLKQMKLCMVIVLQKSVMTMYIVLRSWQHSRLQISLIEE